MIKKSMLTGIVLCGGKSSRMGTDKGLLLKDGEPWSRKKFNQLKALEIPVKISINASQKKEYQILFNETLLIEDTLDIPGPMAGLLSAHQRLEDQDLLLLACDIQDISDTTIEQLFEIYQRQKNQFDFFVFKNESEFEPMLGIYSSKGLRNIYQLLKEGNLKKFSMKFLLETGATFSIPLSKEQQIEFKNYNSKEDLIS